MQFFRALLRFVLLSLRALLHPENPREWRTAYAYFVVPFIMRPGFAVAISWVIAVVVVRPWDWVLIFLWLFYWSGELMLYYTEYHGFADQWEHWIETGSSL